MPFRFLIPGEECFLRLIIRNFHGNTSTKSLRLWLIMLRLLFSEKDAGLLLAKWVKVELRHLGVDWTCSARNARYLSGGNITLQGNFDPSRLLSPIPTIKKMVHEMIDEFGKDKYVVNLGHGILPNIPVDHAKAFIDAVKEYGN